MFDETTIRGLLLPKAKFFFGRTQNIRVSLLYISLDAEAWIFKIESSERFLSSVVLEFNGESVCVSCLWFDRHQKNNWFPGLLLIYLLFAIWYLWCYVSFKEVKNDSRKRKFIDLRFHRREIKFTFVLLKWFPTTINASEWFKNWQIDSMLFMF